MTYLLDGQKCIICYEKAVRGRIAHKPTCPGERKMPLNIADTAVTGGNFKNIITLHFPCGVDKDCKREGGNAPTMLDLATALKKHRETCNECN